MQGEKSILFPSCKSCKYMQYIVGESGLRKLGCISETRDQGTYIGMALNRQGSRALTAQRSGEARECGPESAQSAGMQKSAGEHRRAGRNCENQVFMGQGESRRISER